MKKYIITIFAVLTLASLVSCTNNADDNPYDDNNDLVTNDMFDASADIAEGTENAVDDLTDGTVFDTDKNVNVDEYTANGIENM